jgi:hypothetical protein
VDLVVVLGEANAAALTSIAEPLHSAWRECRVEPLILASKEISSAADAFATKFYDIRSYHVVLLGEDVFSSLVIQREDLRRRLEQELWNLSFRLRRRFVALYDSPVELLAALRQIARPLAICLETMLRLQNEPIPDDDRTAAIFDLAAAKFELDRETLRLVAQLRQQKSPDGVEPVQLFQKLMAVVSRVAEIADRS